MLTLRKFDIIYFRKNLYMREKGMESNLKKINESLFFTLTCDEVGTYVSLVDSNGDIVENLSLIHI